MSEREDAWDDIGGSTNKEHPGDSFKEAAKIQEELLQAQRERVAEEANQNEPEEVLTVEESKRRINEVLGRKPDQP